MPSPVDREVELGRVAELVARVAAGGPGAALVIEGPAGIGKTRLCEEAQGLASERGVEVCAARGAELERSFAFGLVRRLLAPPLAAAGPARREELLAGAAALALGALERRPAGEVDPAGVLYGLYWLVAGLAEQRPLLLVVDDAQWGDEASLRFLAHLFRRAESLPLLVIVTTGPPTAEDDGTPLFDPAADPAAELLRPGALGVGAVGRLLGERLGRPADPIFAEACLEATGGNPFLLGELARELRRGEIDPVAAAADRVAALRPDRVAHSLTVRIERAGEVAARLAPAIALLGDDADPALVGELAGLAPDAVGESVDRLVREQVLVPASPPRYAHPLLRTAAAGLLAPAERSRLHGRAAELLAARGAPLEQLAAHLLETQPGGDPHTVEVLVEAAREAAGRGAPDAAARMLRRALAEPPAAEQSAAIHYALGRAERELGLDSAREHLWAAAGSEDPLLAGRATRALLWAIGPDPEQQRRALPLLDAALERLDESHRGLARELEALRLGALGLVPGQAERLERELSHCLGLPGESPASSLALTFVARVLMQRGEPAIAVEAVILRAAANLDALRDDDMAAFWLINMTIAAATTDRFDVALRVTERALAIAGERGSAGRFALASSLRGAIRHLAGDLAGAEADARAALACEGLERPMAHRSLVPLVASLADQGRIAEGTRALVEAGLDGPMPAARSLTALLAERARLRIAGGDARAGLADLEEVAARLSALPAQRGVIGSEAWFERIFILQLVGREREAREQAGEALDAARAWGSDRAVGGALRVGGLVTGGEAGVGLLSEAVAILARSPARLLQARALVDLGAAQRCVGREAPARESLRQGLELAERCGAEPLALLARRELAIVGVEVEWEEPQGDALSADERRVAELAIAGASETEIAQELFVTAKAVGGRLARACRKLGVTDRAGLAAALRG